MKVSEEDRETVRRFLNEVVRELWAGNIQVFYEPQMEYGPSTEPAAWSFVFKGLYIEVVQRDGGRPWAQVDFVNFDGLGLPPGALTRLYEAVSAPERNPKDLEARPKEDLELIKAAWAVRDSKGVPIGSSYEGYPWAIGRIRAA